MRPFASRPCRLSGPPFGAWVRARGAPAPRPVTALGRGTRCVLVVGAGGFIGRSIVVALRVAGYRVRSVVRGGAGVGADDDVHRLDLASARACDGAHWLGLLRGVDAVVYAAGVLQPRDPGVAWAVHAHAPRVLYGACERAGVRRVVHLSAVGVVEAETVYARSKRAGDAALMASDLVWTVVRPAVVVGRGSYGATSLLRALAACPFAIPLPGDGATPMDCIDARDLAAGVVALLRSGAGVRAVVEPAGRGTLTVREALVAMRAWLGFAPVPVVALPWWAAGVVARIGDVTALGPVCSTSLAQLRARLVGDAQGFARVTGVQARGLRELLADAPAQTQDRWHARLYLLRPVVRFTLAIVWAVSGLVALGASPQRWGALCDVASFACAPVVTGAAAVLDLVIAAALVRGVRPLLVVRVQLLVIVLYTAVLGALAPALWGDVYGGLVKNLPLLALVCLHGVLEDER